jgi:hypothetical protein
MPNVSAAANAPSVRARRPPRRTWGRFVLLLFLAVWGGTAYWHTHKDLPPGTRVASPWRPVPAANVSFIADVTAADAYGRPVMSQAIFDEVLGVVRSARRFLVLDYFLFNNQRGAGGPDAPTRALSSQLRDALVAQKRANPDLRMLFITDPINDVYGGKPSHDLEMLRDAGIDVVVTDLNRLRDSNYLYSALWRLGIEWWSRSTIGAGGEEGWLPNPLDEASENVTFAAWARLANFKANHRKVIIGDDGNGQIVGIVASANPHDASSAHSNVAAKISGPSLRPLLASELEVARFSGWDGVIAIEPAPAAPAEDSSALSAGRIVRTQVLTEGAIRGALVERINSAVRGEFIDIAMFYISDRRIVDALLSASRRGVSVRLVLDPNKDAFGHEKSGIPNRPVASELVAASDGAIHVRWYRTHGEQFHTKLVLIYGADRLWMTLGSANLTRRNVDDYNLEANVAIETARNTPLGLQVLEYFETLWSNRAALGIEYTADYGVYADPSQGHYWLYRIMESTGLSTF